MRRGAPELFAPATATQPAFEAAHNGVVDFLLAIIPPLWFRVMNPRLAEAQRQAG